jgi:DNA-binding NtrC family response regulator
MRQDLYNRLRTHHIHVPPLRKRRQDIPLLLDYYIEEAAKEFGKNRPTYPPELVQLLVVHNFPGNVRELRAMVYDAVGNHLSRLMSMETFRERIHENDTPAPTPPSEEEGIYSQLKKLPTLKDAADALVREAMRRAGYNQRLASGILGISPSALNKRLSMLE